MSDVILNNLDQLIVALISKDTLSAQEIADKLDYSKRAIKYRLSLLLKMHIIVQIPDFSDLRIVRYHYQNHNSSLSFPTCMTI